MRKQPILLTSLLAFQFAYAKEPEYEAPPLDEVVISVSGYEQKILDTAASVNVVTSSQIHNGQAEDNLSEPLNRVPGIFALNRQNYAQDLQISSRGFGANSTFGTRGIRLYVDNIPGTVADGQGQISHIDLPSTERIEVIRGPFSVLYGNSSGGVISVFSEDGGPKNNIQPYFELGSYSQRKAGIKASGLYKNTNYLFDVGDFHTDGYRVHSAADRFNANSKIKFRPVSDSVITFVANNVNLSAQDPLGLTAAQLAANPKQAGNNAISQNTRKTVLQTQTGFTIDTRIDQKNQLLFTPYYGQRHVTQFLAATNNGVIDLKRDFYGMDSKWIHKDQLIGMPLTFVGGVDFNENDDQRQTYQNNGGIQGALGQTYRMSAKNFDQYAHIDWRLLERLALNFGARNSQTNLSSISNNPSLNNTSSGSHAYQALTSMVSLQYYLSEVSNVYVSYGSSFDTPTLNQVTYNSSFTGSNFGLNAATTKQVEIGFKSKLSKSAQIILALFNANTSNDIVVGASSLGRTSFTNAPKTNRQGIEASAQFILPHQFELNMAYTLLNATVKEAYLNNNAYVLSGNRIPGVPNQGLFSELLWVKPNKSIEAAVEARVNGSMAVNDINSPSMATGYAVLNLRTMFRQEIAGGWSLSQFFRINNILNRSYVGSVIVNQTSSQFYEPAPTRNWLVGAKANYQF
ncbi:MAG: TonB-dependent receptor [Burkholderiaceae bacterium]|nr:TonB-dependent receptor [Burkholderiaceae bacterium]NCA09038.1 TonB-dependent receptor [Burkholderiaceae bacterium]NCV03093.1 TonB-dependent receptor [Burkholderiaceae bacterium]NCV64847.1 TonB-dependent receptor [Burkholderiaceae bacterium]NCY04708.1 TonB-dependent receptor [Burkholderiaceae bacterium]